ncbi:MAG: peptide-N-glycosidase F-related protein [Saprospiraceae bacterium]|nr:peptide-N-glycosidase F-related protein [Saprospiraceae bacterium]
MLKKITLLTFFSFLFLSNFAQITEVQSFIYSSTTRDTVIEFPTADHNTYEKILMVYSMRCKDALVSTSAERNKGCGEWDYSCNTYITDSSRVDSFHTVSPTHLISGFSDDVYNYTTQPTYSYLQSTQSEIIYNNVITELEYTIGSGTTDSEFPFGGGQKIARTQFLYSATDLTAQGMQTGFITGMKLEALNMATGFENLRIRMKQTSHSELEAATMENNGFEEVYYLNSDVGTGNHFFKFYNKFDWDGVSNILLDISYNRNTDASTDVKSNVQAVVSSLSANGDNDQYFEINGAGYVDVEQALPSVQNEITISFWSFGSEELPINTYAFEGVDAGNLRQMNVHLPWSNGQIYWDCGNDGSGYDRINKPASEDEYKNVWSHWSFTKNATTGDMKIYLNGSLWHSGTGFTRPIDIQEFRLGGSANGNGRYYGKMDDFQIWNKELSEATIKEWMTKKITSDHPDYSNLVANYSFDNAVGSEILDSSPNAINGELSGTSIYRNWEGKNLIKNITASYELANLTFVQGEYNSSINTTTILDSLINIPNQIDEYIVNGTDLELNSTNFYYASGSMAVFNNNGVIIDSVVIAAENSIIIGDLIHYTKRPAKFEIMSFVTPYGIGLDFGEEGKSWTFDVTDFGPILKGKKRINLQQGGQWQEDMDIKFVFIEGTPSHDIIDIKQIWPVTSESYTRIIDDVRFEPRNLILPANAGNVKLKATISGHGQEGEFIPRTHFLNIDGGYNEFEWQVWKECADNPIFPQGGTWIYDRAGWCPGEATDIQEFNLLEWVYAGDEVEIDYGVVTASGNSRYIVNAQMVSYGDPNFTLDADIDILTPSNKVEYERYTPMCTKPKVLIKNNGSTTLTSLDITYSVNGISPKTYTWTGNLKFLESKEVELPALNATSMITQNGEFQVAISNPNGGTDEYPNNNEESSTFKIVPQIGTDVVIRMQTNLAGGETTWRIYDANGNLVKSRVSGLSSSSVYLDTIFNLNGCYQLEIQDSGDDGIYFWANGDGSGDLKIKSIGEAYKTLEPDFGKLLVYEFIAGDITPTYNLNNNKSINVFPNPSSNIFNLELDGYSGDIQMELINSVGQVLKIVDLENSANNFLQHQFNLTNFSPGVYYLKINHENITEVKKLIKL